MPIEKNYVLICLAEKFDAAVLRQTVETTPGMSIVGGTSSVFVVRTTRAIAQAFAAAHKPHWIVGPETVMDHPGAGPTFGVQ